MTGAEVEAMRIELWDKVVELVIQGARNLPDEAQLRAAFVAGFEQERRAFRAGVVEGTVAARDGLLDEVTRHGYRSVAIEDEFRVWFEGLADETTERGL